MEWWQRIGAGLGTLALLGCGRDGAEGPIGAEVKAAPVAVVPAARPASGAAAAAEPRVEIGLAEGPTLVVAPDGEAPAAVLRRELRLAASAGQAPIVYIGATWCAPCKVFAAALAAGQLRQRLPPLRFIAFDHDHHGDGLRLLGYRWQLVPMFAVPAGDGRATGRGFGGVPMEVKDAPVDHLVQRLRALMEPERQPLGD